MLLRPWLGPCAALGLVASVSAVVIPQSVLGPNAKAPAVYCGDPLALGADLVIHSAPPSISAATATSPAAR